MNRHAVLAGAAVACCMFILGATWWRMSHGQPPFTCYDGIAVFGGLIVGMILPPVSRWGRRR